MESKESVIERFMRDQEHKANSLYNAGYRAGKEDAVREGFKTDDEIHVGDEVIDSNGLVAIVTNTDTHYHLVYTNGKTWKAPKDTVLIKRGARHRTIEKGKIDLETTEGGIVKFDLNGQRIMYYNCYVEVIENIGEGADDE